MTIEALAIQRLYADMEIGFSGKDRTKTWHICIVMYLFVYDLSKRSRYDGLHHESEADTALSKKLLNSTIDFHGIHIPSWTSVDSTVQFSLAVTGP